MESRRIVPMNLFAGNKWRHRCREWTCRQSRGRRGEDKNEKVALTYIHYHL